MFWQNFEYYCQKNGLTPSAVAKKLGFSNATATKWKKGSIPQGSTLQKIADFFGVPVDYLLGKPTVLNIAKPIDRYILSSQDSENNAEKKEPTATADSELEENIIIFHRNGKTQKRKFTKEQMDMFMAMVDAISESPKDI